jgi:nucleotide-binding universal stress UspA family protein
MYRRIAVGIDGSEGSRQALAAAIALAQTTKGEIFLVSVAELPRQPAAAEVEDTRNAVEKIFRDIQNEAVGRVNAAGLVAHRDIRVGYAAQALSQYAAEVEADLLVIGHTGHSGIWGRLLGTTADKVVDHAPCSVLVVR